MNGRTKVVALTSVLLIALSFVGGSLYLAAAESNQDDATTDTPSVMGGWRMRGLMLGCLDEEQRQELKETIDTMREEGATQEEIRAYIQEYLEGLGVECQMPQLTDEQVEGLRQLRAEIQELVQRRLGELGIDAPLMGRGLGFGHIGGVRAHNQGS
jgi:Spy/CpxP family protein refolding chaperone